MVSTTLLLRSSVISVWGKSRLFLFWIVNRSHLVNCTAYLRVQYSAKFSSFYTRSLYLILLNDTPYCTIVMFAMTWSCTIQLLTPPLIIFSATCKTVLVFVKKWTINNKFQLNEDKTEALLFYPSKSSDLAS